MRLIEENVKTGVRLEAHQVTPTLISFRVISHNIVMYGGNRLEKALRMFNLHVSKVSEALHTQPEPEYQHIATRIRAGVWDHPSKLAFEKGEKAKLKDLPYGTELYIRVDL